MRHCVQAYLFLKGLSQKTLTAMSAREGNPYHSSRGWLQGRVNIWLIQTI